MGLCPSVGRFMEGKVAKIVLFSFVLSSCIELREVLENVAV